MLAFSQSNGPWSGLTFPSRYRPMYQSVPQSMGRVVFNSKNRPQLSR